MDKTYFENAKAQMKEFQEKMKNEGKQFFLNISKELFEQNPTLVKFGWRQYTPYYNDGDECVFSANLGYPRMLLSGQDEKDYDGVWFKSEDTSDEAKVWNNVRTFLSQFDDGDVQSIFGDHVEVVVTKDGVEVEEYSSHD